MTIRFLAVAEAELDDAVAYYEAQRVGLGSEFALAVRDGPARIEEYPKAWQLLGRRVRRYRLSQYPYGLVYADFPSEIIVVAVMHLHLHRQPDYWQDRLTKL